MIVIALSKASVYIYKLVLAFSLWLYSSLADTLCRQTFSLTAYKLISVTGKMKVIASGLVLMAVLSVSHFQGILRIHSCNNNNSVKANFLTCMQLFQGDTPCLHHLHQ